MIMTWSHSHIKRLLNVNRTSHFKRDLMVGASLKNDGGDFFKPARVTVYVLNQSSLLHDLIK